MKMRANKTANPNCFEFGFPLLDTNVLVENLDHEVVIRATRDTFSEERKIFFIRELANEGFISENYLWFDSFNQCCSPPLRWEIDYSWLELPNSLAAKSRKFMIRLLVSAGVAWISLMAAVMLRSM